MEQAFGQGNEQRVVLDTSVCIELLRKNQAVAEEVAKSRDAYSYLSTVTLFELFMRSNNLEPVEALTSEFQLLNFDEKSARKASEIALELKHKGMPIEAADLFIAATAIVNNCALATLNTKDFSRIKGLKLVRLR